MKAPPSRGGKSFLRVPHRAATLALLFALLLTALAADGTLDDTFDGDTGVGDGKVTTDFPSGYVDTACRVAIQTDGTIVVVGIGDGGAFGVARYNTNGSLDSYSLI